MVAEAENPIKQADKKKEVSQILTPGDNMITHEMPENGNTFFVIEVPGVFFEGFKVCLSTKDILSIPKMHYMKQKMLRFWEEIANKHCSRRAWSLAGPQA